MALKKVILWFALQGSVTENFIACMKFLEAPTAYGKGKGPKTQTIIEVKKVSLLFIAVL